MIKIECPHCQKNNNIRLPENSECRHCKRSFDEHSFHYKKLKPILTTLLAGSAIGYIVENKLDTVRFKPELEYAIINQCATSQQEYYTSEKQLQKNTRICICALEKTMKDVAHKKDDIDQEIIKSFKRNLIKCK